MGKHDKYVIGGIILGLVILWSNRDMLMPKESLDLNPNDGVKAIKSALRKIKNGQIIVREMPEEIRKELINAK
jgi:phosphomevalonate kinase